MAADLAKIERFVDDTLMPAGLDVLKRFYQKYLDGQDIDVVVKSDQTPASMADRETEKAIRALIKETFPDHGIIGEEFGKKNEEADFVWVLDPLDGTKQFLAKNPAGFGCLIGLMQNGKPLIGSLGDFLGDDKKTKMKTPIETTTHSIELAHIACTTVNGMFPEPKENHAVNLIAGRAKRFSEDLNCMAFKQLTEGTMDAVIEQDLAIYDLAPLLPLLFKSGITCLTLDGQNWQNLAFDVKADLGTKYGIIAANNDKLALEILRTYKDGVTA